MAQAVMTPEHKPLQHPKKAMMPPVLRGFLWAAIGFLLVNTFVIAVDPFRGHPFVTGPSVTLGWVGAVIGWLLGIGVYDAVLLPLMGFETRWVEKEKGWRRYWEIATDHKVIGLQYMMFAVGGFLIAGAIAMLMRYELMTPYLTIFHYPSNYLTAVGIHGTLMMFSFATVFMIGGLGNYFVPLMIGARETVLSKLSGIGVWLVPAGILTVLFSPILGEWSTGWRGYEPLAGQDANGIIFYYLGVLALTMSSLIVALNLVATVMFRRAPGMTWGRLPLFVWGQVTVNLLMLIWFPEIQTTFVMGLLDKIVPLNFFTATGSPLTYLMLFWLFGHPEVYIIAVPAFALWNEIIPVMAQKSLFGRQWAVIGLVFVMMLSGLVWAHHMFTNLRNSEILPFSFFTEMISIPTGFAYMSAVGTLWKSKIRLTTPVIWILMSMFNFLIGGLTGVFLADPIVNLQLHDTFWVVGHFHYTIIGSMVFSGFGAMYYWLPKLSGRMYNETWGKTLAIITFFAFNLTFSQFFLLGLHGMNRWVPAYPAYLQPMNFEVSIFAFILGASFVANIIYIGYCWANGQKAGENPWNAKTPEWFTSSPAPRYNFPVQPEIVASLYMYGEGTKVPVVTTAYDELAATSRASTDPHYDWHDYMPTPPHNK
ncbi:cytochrome c oxidase subunit 1 [Sulfobacillus thermosulfidooxidans DSM 9293]|uniref:Cytochrome c oxidase subunit 1 n=1 Tax=Sulfobacillus thermosulfidooxidans (strain DSM 9293 / VKM B-1269 / AT-1) TaxID=929705 RepID=A0A1W1WD98_SULTA|nr:cbb3-type cytochrome c oxidase subunit I [Sulfobacillus thermosulfidooxidans]SMC04195.1 cytochrome c oxidase subunit 1 [Sulfobacillus thermosulfidooxidans DSM 9293]